MDGAYYCLDFSLDWPDAKGGFPVWAKPILEFIDSWKGGTKLFPIMTSGSTGAPKEILLHRSAMIASAQVTCNFFGLKKGEASLLALPAKFIAGRMMIVRSMVNGLKLFCVHPASNPLLEFEYEGNIDFAAFTPMQLSLILSSPSSKRKLENFRTVILGGGEVPEKLKEQLQVLKSSFFETYGMTETLSHIAIKKLNGPDRSDFFTVLDGVEFKIDNRGCLMISVPHLSNEVIVTNDFVRKINEKQFEWLGRYDYVINSGGLKISTESLERRLQPYMPFNFFIGGMHDELFGQKVVLFIECSKLDREEEIGLQKIFNDHLGKHEKPKEIKTVEKFTYTESGKIDRKSILMQISP